ncbi:MAG: guanylate kinase [Rhodothermales bacterium]|nr:guanylate kinase [Rhodothermales bacterium]
MNKSKTSNSNGNADRRRIVVLTAPSGSGKTSIARRVMAQMPDLRFSVSVTTRPIRHYERDGVDYHFVSPETFNDYIESGELLEYQEVYPGRLYGTLQREVDRTAAEGPVLLDIDVKGALNVREAFGTDCFVIFIRPPSLEELEKRLTLRGSEDPSSLADRIDKATYELEHQDRFDAVVVNEDLDSAVTDTLALIHSFLDADPDSNPAIESRQRKNGD